ncbi:MAG TPA: GNAT family N-acetyltransferase, partial [Mucilaginibacter sp.]
MIKITIASAKDIEALARVEIESKLRSFPEPIDMVEVEYTNRMRQWTTYFNGETPVSARPERIVFKAIKGEEIIGLIAGHLTSRYSKDAEIQKFYVLKGEQRKGVGTELLKNLLVWLSRHRAKSLCVGIDQENLYQKFYLK